MAGTTKYTRRIAWQHRGRARFVATVEASVAPFAEARAAAADLALAFDIDAAAGVQLDAVGVRVGRSRILDVPIEGVFFSLDATGLGFDEGVWRGPFDADTALTRLPDETYRIVLRAKIAANQWDGSLSGMKAVLDIVFAGTGLTCFVSDGQDMSFTVGLIGPLPPAPPPSPLLTALLGQGLLTVKPSGVRLGGVQRVPVGPHFGFDQANPLMAGFDAGSWGVPL